MASLDAGDAFRAGSLRRNNSIWRSRDDIFSRSSPEEDDKAALKWAALEKLPTYNRLRRGILTLTEGEHKEIDIQSLGLQERKTLLERLVRVAEKDNEKFLLKLRHRIDRGELGSLIVSHQLDPQKAANPASYSSFPE